MNLLLEFDVFDDLIDVPQCVIENRERYRNKFLDWVYNPRNKKRFCEKAVDQSGCKFEAYVYSSPDFIDWLNQKVLKQSLYKAQMIARNVQNFDELKRDGIPVIFF